MDFDIPSIIPIFCFCLFVVTLFKSIAPSKLDSKLPLGPRKLPLIGNLHQLLAGSQPPHWTLRDLALKYGQLMHLQLGEVSTVIVSSPEAAKEVVRTHDIVFANRPSSITTEIMFYKSSNIVFSPHGEHWRQLRKICTMELLSMKRVQTFRSLRQEEFSNMCSRIASKERSIVNLTEEIILSECDVVMQAAIGKKSDELETFTSISNEAAELLGGFYIADLYPSVKLFRLFSRMRRRVEILHKLSDKILEDIINDHKVARNDKQHQDLADVLLEFNQLGHEAYLTIENIKAVLQDVFVGGIETSATIVNWAMAELLKHPRVLKKAQDEVRRNFSKKGLVEESEVNELKYLKVVIKETLRMHPPAPLLVPRESSEHCVIFGYELPKKTRVLVNAWAIGRDPKYWKDPNEFTPERFLDNSIDYKGNDFEYLPFGGGRRICPGMSFGLANVELQLAMLLYHFDWVLPNGIKPENVDMTETLGITARRKHALQVIPIVKISLVEY